MAARAGEAALKAPRARANPLIAKATYAPRRDGCALLERILALGTLAAVLALIVSGRVHRTTAALGGAVAVIGLGLLTESEAVAAVHWEALGLIFGMFVLVAALAHSGFFRWIGLLALQKASFHPLKIFVAFSGLSAFLSAFMDSITVMIFMASLTIEVTRILGMRAGPFLIGEITAANIGGAATMVGDPPNLILGTALGYSFLDFATHTGPIAIALFLVNLAVFYGLHRSSFRRHAVDAAERYAEHAELVPSSAIADHHLLRVSLMVFAFTVTLLVLHQLLDILVAFVAILGATIVLAIGGKDMPELVEKIDWHTLIFLASLFVIVGAVEATGFLGDAATALSDATGGNPVILVTVLLWFSALVSALVDNVPFAAAMVPVIQRLAEVGPLPMDALVWTVAVGADVGGNATPIGASANVVGLAVAEKHGVHISWREYVRSGLPAMVAAVAVANVLLVLMVVRL